MIKYFIWLQLILGAGNHRTVKILEHFGGPHNVYLAEKDTLRHSGLFTAGELKKFDVALYKVGEKYVLHRVIRVLDREYVTCGDNCILLERIPKEAVIGKLIEVWRGEEKLDLDSPEYLAYVRRRVSGFYPRVAYRRARRMASNVKKKIFKK
jgi:hypothetical protein